MREDARRLARTHEGNNEETEKAGDDEIGTEETSRLRGTLRRTRLSYILKRKIFHARRQTLPDCEKRKERGSYAWN